MAKKKHVIRGCKARLRPRLASITRKIQARFQGEKDSLYALLAVRDRELVEAKNQLADSIRDRDVGRTLKSHLSGWWSHRNA